METVSAGFYLINKEAKRELKFNYKNEALPFCSQSKYLKVTLDRSLALPIADTLSHFARN